MFNFIFIWVFFIRKIFKHTMKILSYVRFFNRSIYRREPSSWKGSPCWRKPIRRCKSIGRGSIIIRNLCWSKPIWIRWKIRSDVFRWRKTACWGESTIFNSKTIRKPTFNLLLLLFGSYLFFFFHLFIVFIHGFKLINKFIPFLILLCLHRYFKPIHLYELFFQSIYFVFLIINLLFFLIHLVKTFCHICCQI